MNDVQSSAEQGHRASAVDAASPTSTIWPLACHFADSLIIHIRENPRLRSEFLSLLHELERSVGLPEEHQSNGAHGATNPIHPHKTDDQVAEVESRSPAVETPRTEAPPPVPASPLAKIDQRTVEELERTLGSLNPHSETIVRRSPFQGDRRTELRHIIECCRLKAKASRWAAERRQLIARGADFRAEIAPRDKELLARAGEFTDCFLWMCNPAAPLPKRIQAYEDLADRFENAADAAQLLSEIVFDECMDDLLEDALNLAAESQASVRAALSAVGYGQEDFTQVGLFIWLKDLASEQQLYIPRFMRRTDVADASAAELLAARIAEYNAVLQKRKDLLRRTKNALNTLKHHARQLAPERDNRYDWGRIFTQIEAVVPSVIPPTDVRFRELLADKLDLIPDDLEAPLHAQEVLEAIDEFLSAQPQSALDNDATPPETSQEVLRVRNWLRGKTLVLIGGDSRPFAKEALQAAFEPSEVVWITSRAHESPEGFRTAVRGKNVGIVLLAIRWSSHCFGVVKHYCDEAGKPFVRLPAGYNPKQVAHQILEQVPGITGPLS